MYLNLLKHFQTLNVLEATRALSHPTRRGLQQGPNPRELSGGRPPLKNTRPSPIHHDGRGKPPPRKINSPVRGSLRMNGAAGEGWARPPVPDRQFVMRGSG